MYIPRIPATTVPNADTSNTVSQLSRNISNYVSIPILHNSKTTQAPQTKDQNTDQTSEQSSFFSEAVKKSFLQMDEDAKSELTEFLQDLSDPLQEDKLSNFENYKISDSSSQPTRSPPTPEVTKNGTEDTTNVEMQDSEERIDLQEVRELESLQEEGVDVEFVRDILNADAKKKNDNSEKNESR
jgi:hypothetical protein